jgi:adenine-specific DNA methylase
VGKEAKDDPSEDFLTVNETGPGHEVKETASYMMMMMMMMMMMNSISLRWYYTDYLLEDTDTHFGFTAN